MGYGIGKFRSDFHKNGLNKIELSTCLQAHAGFW